MNIFIKLKEAVFDWYKNNKETVDKLAIKFGEFLKVFGDIFAMCGR